MLWSLLLVSFCLVNAVPAPKENLKTYNDETGYGSYIHPAPSCHHLLMQSTKILPNGIYFISPTEGECVIPVYCDMLGGGWTMVFKAVAGFNFNPMDYWKSEINYGEHSSAPLDLTNSYKPTYKNRLVNNWRMLSFKEVRVSLFTGGKEDVHMVFDGEGSDNQSWYAKEKIIETQWRDINTEKQNYFKLEGDQNQVYKDFSRTFYINRNYGGCHIDIGWFVVTTNGVCAWEKRFPHNSFLYSKKNTMVNWNEYANVGSSEVLAVFVR